METLLKDAFGYLFEPELIEEILRYGTLKKVPAGECIIDYEDPIGYMPLMLEGAIKILRKDDEGEELLLYFLERGDTCSMTMSCCMGKTRSEIRAVAEMDSTLVMIPVGRMPAWLQQFASWRAFVFESYDQRFKELLSAIDSLAFLNMHDRVLKYLRDKAIANKGLILQSTHREIAADLHTSRVVISRILKSLEKEGKLSLHRNRIELASL